MAKFVDQSTASDIDKAKSFLRSLRDGGDGKYFYPDGFPKDDNISQDAMATLEVLKLLETNNG
jgi:hypothetical protein